MRHHAIQAVVGRTGGGHDHLAFTLAQATLATHRLGHHQRVVVCKKRTPLGRASGKGQKHIGHKTGFFLYFEHFGSDVLGQVLDLGCGVAVAHKSPLLCHV